MQMALYLRRFFEYLMRMKKAYLTVLMVLSALFTFASGPVSNGADGFRFAEFFLDNNGNLHWTTVNEDDVETFYVEQYVYNRWMTLEMMNGEAARGAGIYSYRVANVMHSGTNLFRIRKTGHNYIDAFSDVIETNPQLKRVYHFQKRHRILLSKRVYYYIYDEAGVLLKKDYGSVIPTAKYRDENFYLCYDNNVVLIKNGFLSF